VVERFAAHVRHDSTYPGGTETGGQNLTGKNIGPVLTRQLLAERQRALRVHVTARLPGVTVAFASAAWIAAKGEETLRALGYVE
jgi:hypothetical protein